MKNDLKHIWVCEDCLSENLEKKPNGEIKEWETIEICGAIEDDLENYCNDCESFTHKINRGMISLMYDENDMGENSTTSQNFNEGEL